MQEGLFTIDDKYYLGPDGIMKTGLAAIGNHYYYFGSDGSMNRMAQCGKHLRYLSTSDIGLEEVEKTALLLPGKSNDGAMKTGSIRFRCILLFRISGAFVKG